MSMGSQLQLRDGEFDVVVLAGPRVSHWPTAGARAISTLCAEMGLTVGLFGGEGLTPRGVLALPGTGGIALVEDGQNRLHRLRARAIVKLSSDPRLPDPFPGWFSEGLLPLSTAAKLRHDSEVLWDPATVILGTGNKALRFGSDLLESGVPEVICLEMYPQWGAKRFAGWEVERRRFEMAGGELVEARPVSLTPKAALLWEFRMQDAQGVRVVEVARVIAAGPFRDSLLAGVREYPPGSFLFEIDQSAGETKEEDVEGWVMEEERGRYLAGRIVRTLVTDLSAHRGREELDRIYNRARGRLKRYFRHRDEPFTPSYQGKWIEVTDSRRMRAFTGMPQGEQKKRLMPSIECFEEIPCNLCAVACPEDAIRIGKVPRPPDKVLDETRCTACGICVSTCPSAAIAMVHEPEERPTAQVVLPWRGARRWRVGEFATLVNRRGDNLGTARVIEVVEESPQRVKIEVPSHLAWEARGLRLTRNTSAAAEDEAYLTAVERSASAEHKVEITLDGEKRLVRDKIPLSMALFEAGRNRPSEGLFCADGSCGLCHVDVDGVKRLACMTKVHRGMAVKFAERSDAEKAPDVLCPCMGVTREQVLSRLRQGSLSSPEAVLSVLHVGEGKCHGQLCMSAFRRILAEEGVDVTSWVDWRFPWSDWVLQHS